MNLLIPAIAALTLNLAACASDPVVRAATSTGASVDAKAAFERLKSLAGEWRGTVTRPDGDPGASIWRVTAGGSAVMETQFPGTAHEMVSMYHLDGDDLVLTHYCAARNQPKMRLKSATEGELVFEFAGGTGFDAARDMHVHEGTLRLLEVNRIEANWVMFAGGSPKQNLRFFLKRV
jgi:hypothetical protein